jgi:hypothetical protein
VREFSLLAGIEFATNYAVDFGLRKLSPVAGRMSALSDVC